MEADELRIVGHVPGGDRRTCSVRDEHARLERGAEVERHAFAHVRDHGSGERLDIGFEVFVPSRGATKNATGKNGPVVAATVNGTPSTIGIGRLAPVTSAAIGTEQNGPCPTCERAARLPATPLPVIGHGLPPRPATNALSETSNWLAPSQDNAAPPTPPNAWSPPCDAMALACNRDCVSTMPTPACNPAPDAAPPTNEVDTAVIDDDCSTHPWVWSNGPRPSTTQPSKCASAFCTSNGAAPVARSSHWSNTTRPLVSCTRCRTTMPPTAGTVLGWNRRPIRCAVVPAGGPSRVGPWNAAHSEKLRQPGPAIAGS